MANAKIRIKVGDIEVEYEGEAAFLEKSLMGLVKELQTLPPAVAPSGGAHKGHPSGSAAPAAVHQLTTKSIATKHGAKSGSEVAVAAVAHLGIMKQMAHFKRSEINDAMKAATGIYNANMSSNLTSIVSKLLSDDVIVETTSGVYSLTPGAEAELKGQLGLE